MDSLGVLLLVYNIVVAMVSFYMIYKPFQYQQKYLNGSDSGAYCFVDTLGYTWENVLTVFVDLSLSLLALQWLLCCCKLSRHSLCHCIQSESVHRVWSFVVGEGVIRKGRNWKT